MTDDESQLKGLQIFWKRFYNPSDSTQPIVKFNSRKDELQPTESLTQKLSEKGRFGKAQL
jgi:hypothetical protein